jgi:dTDP-4-dehydrorhamnose reductase
MMQKILITGSSGFLGQYVLSALPGKFMPVTVNRNSGDFTTDLKNESALRNVLNQIDVSAVIHLAANGNVNDCELNPDESRLINVRATQILVEWANEKQIPFVFTSTDQVFDGSKGNYSENDDAHPVNEYGKQKLEAEKTVLLHNGIVCRLPLMTGSKGGYEKSFTENLQQGITQVLFTDEWRAVLHAGQAASGLILALQWPSGIYHLGGAQRINRYELGMKIADKYPHLDKTLIKPGKQADVNFTAKRPADVSLNSEKALKFGFRQQ